VRDIYVPGNEKDANLQTNLPLSARNMRYFLEMKSKGGPETTPYTTWILKGRLKDAEAGVVSASQLSSDSMQVDDDGKNVSVSRDSFLLVSHDKLEGT
jgi:hypothetical protein